MGRELEFDGQRQNNLLVRTKTPRFPCGDSGHPSLLRGKHRRQGVGIVFEDKELTGRRSVPRSIMCTAFSVNRYVCVGC